MADVKKTDAMDALIASAMPYIQNRELAEYEAADPSVVLSEKTVRRRVKTGRVLPLFRHELSKYCTRFHLVLLAALLFANLAVTAVETGSWWQNSGDVRGAVNALLDDYRHDRAEYDALAADYEQRAQSSRLAPGEFENRLIDVPGYGDSDLFRDAAAVTERSEITGGISGGSSIPPSEERAIPMWQRTRLCTNIRCS